MSLSVSVGFTGSLQVVLAPKIKPTDPTVGRLVEFSRANFKFQKSNLKAIFPEKELEKFIDGKGISVPQNNSDFSKRNVIKNSEFNCKNMSKTYSLFSIMITNHMNLFQKDALKLHTLFRFHFILSFKYKKKYILYNYK